ncbi:MAG: KH domain-containing protein [Methermicoccaceae archaeon]
MAIIRIPSERIGVLIGQGGKVKKMLEEESRSKLIVDSESGEVQLVDVEDPVLGMRATDVIKAIGRGFNPEIAFTLFNDEMLFLEVITLTDVVNGPKALERIRGRIIGKKGMMRRALERATGAKVSIYGKTVAIIGKVEAIQVVKNAINMLISGAPHGTVYSYLERERKKLDLAKIE